MAACQCDCYDAQFSDRVADAELRRYRRKGPIKTTRFLIDALREAGVAGGTLLDVGGGVGAIQHELMDAGVRHAVQVDAARPYLSAARAEAERRGHADRATFVHGDFVTLAPGIEPADIVTLDRVICCYADVEALVAASASRARRLYGVVVPRDEWWVRAGDRAANGLRRLRRSRFRTFVHRIADIDAAVRREGLTMRSARRTLVWEIRVYVRSA